MLQGTMPRVTDYDDNERVARLTALMKVRDGRQYDHLSTAFSEERTGGGDYVPLDQRRPSARTNVCRIVVNDAVSLLFGEGHWPSAADPGVADTALKDALTDISKTCRLNLAMIEAAIRGSVGSVCLWVRCIEGRPYVGALETRYLTPEYADDDPAKLVKVTEKRKVTASELKAKGYNVDSQHREYWFQRIWDVSGEVWYQPWPVRNVLGEAFIPQIDFQRTPGPHGLGFLPMIWVKNLPGDCDSIDGASTFEIAIDTVIEADYLLSQAGRGLKYASDPTLVLKDDGGQQGKAQVGGAASAIIVPPDGDATLLEINGSAATAVLEHVRELRKSALEQIRGNRSDSDKLSTAQSGRAMEMLYWPLICLADDLRISYGEGALLSLYKMLCEISKRLATGLVIGNNTYRDLDGSNIALTWPSWFAPTYRDMAEKTGALAAGITAQIISKQTATKQISAIYDIEDVDAEQRQIQTEAAEQDAREIAIAAAVQVKETTSA